MKCLYILLVCLSLSQETNAFCLADSSRSKFSLQATLGYTWRSNILDQRSYSLNTFQFTDFSANTMGFGLNTGIQFIHRQTGLTFDYSLTTRYDHKYYERDNQGLYAEEVKGLLFDNNFSLLKYFKSRRQQYLHPKRKPAYLGAGYHLINTGARFDYINEFEEKKQFNLSYPAWGIGAGIPVWNLYIEPGVRFVSKGRYPFAPRKGHTMLTIRVYYPFKLI